MSILSKITHLLNGQSGTNPTRSPRPSRFQPSIQALETRDQPGSLGLGASIVAPSSGTDPVAPTVQLAIEGKVELKDQVNVEL
jgi:hypothetical protein